MNIHRYQRQISLSEFGPRAQQKLAEASVLVVGVGGLGIPVLQYLNAMGVGTLGLVEQDVIELTNLQRQVLYEEGDVGKPKISVALERLKAQNSDTHFKSYDTFLTKDNALAIIADFDIVVDASDNFATRYLVNDACVILKKPFVYGALHGFEGQVSVFNYQGGPTYRCLFPKMPLPSEVPNCNENGVLGVLPGIVGNLQALEVIKVITGVGEVLSGKLLLFNGLNQSYQKIVFKLRPENLNFLQLQNSYGAEGCSLDGTIDVMQLQELLQSNKNLQLIDVRTKQEFNDHSLPKAKNIPLDELAQSLPQIDLTQPTYLICQSGKRSEIALKLLQDVYPKSRFYHILGGMNRFLATCS
ncbi:ThiF family adenylyltransferase [Spongiimicrobium sp. 3-5]|uniref:ThiF family adenylyltransferase n=1 Tax=Spongiimicrobium sp. 3-5 TaxID=3332596 RepID=UPI00397FE875